MRAGHGLDAALAENTLRLAGHFGVFERQDARQVFHHGNLRPEGVVEIRQLRPDGSRSDHQHRFGQLLQGERLPVTDDALPVLRQAGQLARTRSGSDQDVRGRQFTGRSSVRGDDLHPMTRQHARRGGKHVDLVLFHQEFHPPAHLGGNVAAALHDGRQVGRRDRYSRKGIVGRVVQIGVDFRAFQQGFGGDATPVEADPAQVFPLHDSGAKPQLSPAYGSAVPTRAGADHDQVVGVFHRKNAFEKVQS